MGITRVVALAMMALCLLAGCGTTSLLRGARPIALAAVQFVTRCEGLGGPEGERELHDALVGEIRRRGLLCEDAAATKLGVWLTVAERIRFSPEGRAYRYDCDVLIASAKGDEGPEKVLERSFTVDFCCRDYLVVRKAIVNRLGDLVEEAAGKI